MAVIGERVMVGRHSAVIRYVGEVSGYPGIWAGVEWDDPNRGKHNGVVNGVRYFRTNSARGGSLVNIQNVHRGVDLLTAILHRYADTVADDVFVIKSRAVELVGMQSTSQKQSNVFELSNIVLESCLVAGPPAETCSPFRKCVSLNLFNNLLQRWQDVRKILTFFPRLQELDLRKNCMEAACVGNEWSDVKHLSDLILSDCGLTSESTSNVLCYLPGLRTLYAVGNRFTQFFVPKVADSLVNLDIGNNPISCFSNISGNLNKLEKLCVANCGIKRIVIGNGQFPNLTTLNIKENVISDWRSVNQLQLLPRLSVLYMNCENLHCVQGIHTHEVVIAKLPGLVDLNHFVISVVERHSAEVRFLDKYFCAEDSMKAEHITDIERLRKIHGTANIVNSKSSGVNVVLLSICYKGNTVEKRLPLAMTVQKLTEMVGRMFSVESMHVKFELNKGSHQILLENPLRTLDFYSPEPGDILRLLDV